MKAITLPLLSIAVSGLQPGKSNPLPSLLHCFGGDEWRRLDSPLSARTLLTGSRQKRSPHFPGFLQVDTRFSRSASLLFPDLVGDDEQN
ncbi:hypothetical protein BU26DRAFT_298470 [Trematosphaeria pertusa]|uniref:Uncharacterized protein n=1 Tax=Trematosphaeria pertusa TaxID=390896 RepID=A0A6A6IK56_9PLEO|nr:uncharacterized protein BU26DRAFT_298470 [Trematosphaeria pertusa]KAF2250262.1 hypothetical protein BU26DRAFT_298470 [Trematosphaeria pertusa]